MRKSNFALRHAAIAPRGGAQVGRGSVALNQLINVAVAEKVSALRTVSYITERAARANVPKALGILKRAGIGRPPIKGDELSRSTRTKR